MNWHTFGRTTVVLESNLQETTLSNLASLDIYCHEDLRPRDDLAYLVKQLQGDPARGDCLWSRNTIVTLKPAFSTRQPIQAGKVLLAAYVENHSVQLILVFGRSLRYIRKVSSQPPLRSDNKRLCSAANLALAEPCIPRQQQHVNLQTLTFWPVTAPSRTVLTPKGDTHTNPSTITDRCRILYGVAIRAIVGEKLVVANFL